MRRTATLYMPTLLLWPIVQVGGVIVFWLSQTAILGNAFAAAPITPSGLNTQVSAPMVTGNGATQTTQYNITGGTRPGGGGNLYHSFGEFTVPNHNIANFLNDSGLSTSNILGRVTGGNISSILGTIQTTGFGNANLFLMNPAGFLFGLNAAVNVGGMVSFSSADYLRLQDIDGANSGIFHADPGKTSVLTTAPVAAYGFLGSNPGAITVQGSQLSVTPGQSISLVGGNITVQNGTLENGTVQPARLLAPNGQINLATAASPGEFLLQGFQGPPDPSLLTGPNINGASFASFGSVHLASGSTVDVSQTGDGKLSIRGGQLVLEMQNAFLTTADPAAPSSTPGQDTIVLAGGSTIFSQTSSADPAPDVQISAGRIQFFGTPPSFDPVFTPPNPVNIFSDTLASGDAGNITVAASQDIDLITTQIHSISPTSTGNAGNISLSSMNGNISMTAGVFINSQALGAAGGAGSITVNAPHGDINMPFLAVLNNFIGGTSSGASGGGGIEVTANNLNMGLLSSIQIDNFGLPVPKGITLNLSGSLNLTDNAGIFTIAHGPALAAADLNITAHAVSVTGGSSLNTETQSSGPGGQLNISTNTLSLLSGGQIKSGSTAGQDPNLPPDISPIIPASGPGGTINVQGLGGPAGSVLIDGAGSGIFTNALGTGTAGNTNITAHSLTIQNGGTITAATAGISPPATGGTITVKADTVTLNSGGTLTATSSGPGAAGEVVVQGLTSPARSVLIDGAGSGISTDTRSTGAGGNIFVDVNSVTLQNGGSLSAATSGTASSATGGTILVKADTVTLNTGGTMTAKSTGAGASGEVVVQGLASPAQSILIDGSGSGIFTNTSDTGAGGDILLSANSVTLQNGGALSAATTGTASSATGGTITVNAGNVAVNSQSVITADTNGIAPAGTIDINTGTLAINGGGQIRSSSGAETGQVSAFALSSTGAPSLTGGTITVQGRTAIGSQADSVTIDGAGSGVFTESTGTRPGGDINILTSQSVAMTDGAHISASSTGTGNAGNIQINAGNQLAMNNSSVTTEANQASGGAIKITTTPSGTVQLTDSTITASVLDGTGGGGSVDIDPQFVILQNSQILANSVFGPGGNISITTNLLLPDTTSVISASSQFGQQGTIVIQSPVSPASGKLVPLGQKPLIATALVSQRCAALAGGNASSFTIAGRDSLPAEPGGWVSSPLALSLAESNEGTPTEPPLSSFMEIEEGTPLLSLRKVAPAGFLTQSFGAASSDCQS
jgi:filamentous hemagglutinin family protein